MLSLLDLADLQRATGTLVEQLDEFSVEFIDLATPICEIHGTASRRESPLRAARFNAAILAHKASFASRPARSISDTSAEPTTAASTRPPNTETCAGCDIPKPTAIGRSVDRRTRRISAGKSSGSTSLAPVTPVREM